MTKKVKHGNEELVDARLEVVVVGTTQQNSIITSRKKKKKKKTFWFPHFEHFEPCCFGF